MSKIRDLAASHACITALAPNATTLNFVASRGADLERGIDRAGYGTPDFKDFLATTLGATVVLPALLL